MSIVGFTAVVKIVALRIPNIVTEKERTVQTMRDRLIELIRNAPRKDVVYGDIKLEKPVQTIQTIADHLLANGVTVQEWISVKDRLPENDQKVLCFNYNGEYKVLRWNYIDWMWNSGIEWLKEDYVIFWMPMPQPPKGE